MITLRGAEAADVPALLEIYAWYVEHTAVTFDVEVPDAAQFLAKLTDIRRRYPYLVLLEDGRIRGYAYAAPLKDRAAYDWSCELSIYLSPGCRGRGLGRRLYAALQEELSRMGMRNLYACIASPREADETLDDASEAFHAAMGFRRCAMFSCCGYKFDRWYDMIWMEKIIGEHPRQMPAILPWPGMNGGERERSHSSKV